MRTILSILLALSFSPATHAGFFWRRHKTPSIDRCAPTEVQLYVSMICPYKNLRIRVDVKILASPSASRCSTAEYTEASTAGVTLIHPNRPQEVLQEWRLLSGKFEYSEEANRFDSRAARLHLENCRVLPSPAPAAVSFGN